MRVALVHDDLVQWGGAERILMGICEIFPDAPIYTSVFDKSNIQLYKRFGNKLIKTSFLQKIPGWRTFYKALLPLYPIAFEQFNFDEYDLVISQTTRFAKSIISKPKTFHLSFVHTPPRFLWHLSKQLHPQLEFLFSKLRIYDQISSQRVDYFLAGSKNARRRIKKFYGRDSEVLYPFVDFVRLKNMEPFNGGYFLIISRLNKYKSVDLAIKACSELNIPLKIIGVGSEGEKLKQMAGNDFNIEFLSEVSDEILTRVLAGCKALIVPGEEDFGLVSIEAQALGKQVIAYGNGGSLETIIEGSSGIFFNNQTVKSLKEAIKKIDQLKIDPQDCLENAKRFSKEKFLNNFQQILARLGYTIN